MTKTNDPVREVLRELSAAGTASPGERFITSRIWRDFDAVQGDSPTPDLVAVRSAEELAYRSVGWGDAEHQYVPSDVVLAARPATLVDALTIRPVDELAGITERKETSSTGGADTHTFASTPGGTATYTEFSASFTRSNAQWTRIVMFSALDEDAAVDDQAVSDAVDVMVREETISKLEDVIINASVGGGDNFDGLAAAAGTTITRDTLNGETRHSAIRKAATVVGNLPGRALLMNPADAETLALETDGNGSHLAGAGILDDALDSRIQSDKIPAGTAIVASLPRQRLWVRRPGVSVGMSVNHADWFARGWLALRTLLKAHLAPEADSIVAVTL